jgi:hypothetical protein
LEHFPKSPLTVTLDYEGDGYRVSLTQLEGGWHEVVRSSWHRDGCSARARAARWSAENANGAIRKTGADRKRQS